MDRQGYGFRRENRKRSWKSLDFDCDADDDGGTTTTTSSSMLKVQCKACNKEFASPKALFGHMRLHSRREKKGVSCQVCGRKFQYLKALTGHMRLHRVKLGWVLAGESGFDGSRHELPLESITVRRKRTKRTRYNNNAPNSSLSSLNESSGLVGIDQDEEDAALCLIMLSMGLKDWSEFNSVWESSYNNSEIRSLPQNLETMVEENGNLCHDGDEFFPMKKPSECKELLESGVVADEVKKIGSEALNDMSCGGVEFRVSKVDKESGFELDGNEIEERMAFRSVEVEQGQGLMEGLDCTKSSSEKCDMFDACRAEPGGVSLNKLISSPLNSDMLDDPLKNDKYKCRICSKTFKSHQALGGHQTIHRRSSNSCAVEEIENCKKITYSSSFPEIEASCKLLKVEDYDENSVDQEINGLTSYGKRVYKVHECGICFKVFASGQALGGHKRSHISDKQPIAKQLEFSDISDVIDLNIPVMHNEEANGDIGFKSCRVGSDCKSEALLSLVAN